jgi:hypothetical protein
METSRLRHCQRRHCRRWHKPQKKCELPIRVYCFVLGTAPPFEEFSVQLFDVLVRQIGHSALRNESLETRERIRRYRWNRLRRRRDVLLGRSVGTQIPAFALLRAVGSEVPVTIGRGRARGGQTIGSMRSAGGSSEAEDRDLERRNKRY